MPDIGDMPTADFVANPSLDRALPYGDDLRAILSLAAADTAGKPSLAWRGRRAARQVSASVAAAVPGVTAGGLNNNALTDSALAEKVGHGLAVGAERGRELADAARERA